ncbi:MAG: hypothetical protein NC904_08645 [Candidatus Omnitrophica bacterium]|nr:hypothetical protein [Candidatus Omnitrophota bacterium]
MIRRVGSRLCWAKSKRRIWSVHSRKVEEFEELYHGILLMVLFDMTYATHYSFYRRSYVGG